MGSQRKRRPEAVLGDDGDRDDEEERQPADRKAEQARRREADAPPAPPSGRRPYGFSRRGYAAFTSSQAFAYSGRRGMLRSRCANGSVMPFGLSRSRAFSVSAEVGRASVFACPYV